MLNKTFEIALNTKFEGSQATDIKVSQGDVKSVVFNFRIFDSTNEISYANVSWAALFVLKPDRETVQQTAAIHENGGLTVLLGQQALAAPGRATGGLVLYGHAGEAIVTLFFDFSIARSLINTNEIESTADFDALQRAVELLEKAIARYEYLESLDPNSLVGPIGPTGPEGPPGPPGESNPRGRWSPSIDDYKRGDTVVFESNYGDNSYFYISMTPGSQIAPREPGSPWQFYVAQGPPGKDGIDGKDGIGVSSGGTKGQIYTKASDDDGDTAWADPQEGGTTDHAQLENLSYEASGHVGFASQSALDEVGENVATRMPQAPPNAVHGAIGDSWVQLEGAELRSVVTVNHPATIIEHQGIYEIANWDDFEVITLEHNGAQVNYNKGFSQPELYAMGDGKLYKFTFDPVAHTVAIDESAVGSNSNILHNWDFRNPVNQRGQNSYTGWIHTIDRWHLGNIATSLNMEEDGVRIFRTGTSTTQETFRQTIDFPNMYRGRYLVATVEFSDIPNNNPDSIVIRPIVNNVIVGAIRRDVVPVENNITRIIVYFRVPDAVISQFRLAIAVPAAFALVPLNFKVHRAKLEQGSVSTLANDPPMDFGRELAVCQRYQIGNMGFGSWVGSVGATSNIIRFFVPLPVTLRVAPTIPTGFQCFVGSSGGMTLARTLSVITVRNEPEGVRIEGTISGEPLSTPPFSVIVVAPSTNLFLDANL